MPSVSAAISSSFLAVSTPLESVATTSNASVVSNLSGILSTLCFTELLPSLTITQWLLITHLDLTLISVVQHIPWNVLKRRNILSCKWFLITCRSHFDQRRNHIFHGTFLKRRNILSCKLLLITSRSHFDQRRNHICHGTFLKRRNILSCNSVGLLIP